MQIQSMASIPVLYAELMRRSTLLLWSGMGIDGGVEVRVVVHLHLAVEFEAAVIGLDLVPKVVKTDCEVAMLLAQQGKAGAVLLMVGLTGRGSVDLFPRVVELEGEDGKTIHYQAGGFGVERRGGVL
jgi:hypothetical protein